MHKSLTVHVVEDHNEVLPHIHRAIGSKKIPFDGISLVHFDSHPDLLISRDLLADQVYDKEFLYNSLSIENWIAPLLYAGHVNKVLWMKPYWADQIKDQRTRFCIGKHKSSKTIRLDCKENYFIGELLYASNDSISNVKEVDLCVHTLGCQKSEYSPSAKKHKSDRSTDDANQVYEDLNVQKPYILDIDLDFFSTRNPFLDIYSNEQMALLKEIYRFKSPENTSDENIKICCDQRQLQLDMIKKKLDMHKKGEAFKVENNMDELLKRLITSLEENAKCNSEEVDFNWLHEIGMTCDDTELPDHVSSEQEITHLAELFKNTLKLLPEPDLITIARSSDDDYCPKHQVDMIQRLVLSSLKELYKNVTIKEHYKNENT